MSGGEGEEREYDGEKQGDGPRLMNLLLWAARDLY